MYDWPYRIEQRTEYNGLGMFKVYVVMRTGDGTVCESEDYMALRRLVDAANMAASIEMGDSGR